MRNKNKHTSYHPDARRFEDLTPAFKDDYDWSQDHPDARHFEDTTPLFRDESKDNPSLLGDQPEESYALKLRSIPKLFHDGDKAINDNSGRIEKFAPHTPQETDPASAQWMPLQPSITVPRPRHHKTEPSHRSAPIPPSLDNPVGDDRVLGAREFTDTTQIFESGPPTEKEFWENKNEASRALRAARKVGHVAIRGVRVATAATAASALIVPGAFKAAVHTGEALHRGADRATSMMGVAPENPVRQHMKKYIESAPASKKVLNSEIERISKWVATTYREPRAYTHDPLKWDDRRRINEYRAEANQHLQHAQQAYERGEKKAAEHFLKLAQESKDAAENLSKR